MMFQKFLIALGVCVAVTVGLFYAKENGERSGSRPLGHLWSLFHLFGDQCETNSKTSLTSRPQEVFSSSHQLPCYRIHRRLVIVGINVPNPTTKPRHESLVVTGTRPWMGVTFSSTLQK
jgi:hypothetical protein